jgi:hypothetical protein
MAGNKPSFRIASVKQLVIAMEGKDRIEPSYRFSTGKLFTKKVQQPTVKRFGPTWVEPGTWDESLTWEEDYA